MRDHRALAVNRTTWAIILILAAVAISSSSRGQDRRTSAPCGPAIAQVNGNVQVNCGVRDNDVVVEEAIRHLIGDKPFTLNATYPDYRRHNGRQVRRDGADYLVFDHGIDTDSHSKSVHPLQIMKGTVM
jgi:hypothetical protein